MPSWLFQPSQLPCPSTIFSTTMLTPPPGVFMQTRPSPAVSLGNAPAQRNSLDSHTVKNYRSTAECASSGMPAAGPPAQNTISVSSSARPTALLNSTFQFLETMPGQTKSIATSSVDRMAIRGFTQLRAHVMKRSIFETNLPAVCNLRWTAQPISKNTFIFTSTESTGASSTLSIVMKTTRWRSDSAAQKRIGTSSNLHGQMAWKRSTEILPPGMPCSARPKPDSPEQQNMPRWNN